MSAGTEGVVHYDVTTLALVEALRGVPLTSAMTREALVKMADALLGQMPEARGEAEIRADAAVAERSRVFVAIRHGIPLDKPWRGEALDLIFDAIQPREQP